MRLGGRLIAQLRRLQEHAQALSRGQWEHATEPSGVRELAELSAAFNQMGEAIRQRTAQLESANRQLEGEIAERQAAQEALQRAAEQLTSSNKELEQFAYIASHDLQEPLRVVTGYVQLIERKYKGRLDAEAEQFMEYIRDGVSRMQQLITDLLSYSRLGTRSKPFGPVKAETVLERAVTNLQPLIDQNSAVVAHQALPEVRGDETQLLQLFQNLIANAVKFHGHRRPQVDISARPENGQWVFAVHDNGIGIERQYWEQIFAIFQRLHTRQKYPGTGIGLAVCKRIVERHGGRIWLDSQPDQGTTFYFTLPSGP
jgi:light-regulated signal transduction histidine kinase (bacteriophytochrome)